MISLSVVPSVCCLRTLIKDTSSLPLAQSGSYFFSSGPLFKGVQWLWIKFLSIWLRHQIHLIYPSLNLLFSPLCQGFKSSDHAKKSFFPVHIYNIHSVIFGSYFTYSWFLGIKCFNVNCKGHRISFEMQFCIVFIFLRLNPKMPVGKRYWENPWVSYTSKSKQYPLKWIYLIFHYKSRTLWECQHLKMYICSFVLVQ